MSHVELGKYNQLEVVKEVDFGLYLEGDEDGEILLPKRYVPEGCKPGDWLNVFIYLDMDERLVATTLDPYAQVGEFACLQVAWTNEYGAFLDWGLTKDLFVPFREQKMRMVQDRSYLVYIHVDPETQRLVGTAKVERYLKRATPDRYHRGQEVEIIVQQKTPLGFRCIVDNRCGGHLYDNQIFDTVPHTGDVLTATVVNIRPDGRLDLSLQRIGKGRFRDFAGQLLEELHSAGGTLPFSDHSTPEEIQQRFGVSKKTFKRALGTLYKSGHISIEEDCIFLKK